MALADSVAHVTDHSEHVLALSEPQVDVPHVPRSGEDAEVVVGCLTSIYGDHYL
jgi:hypothetical protein